MKHKAAWYLYYVGILMFLFGAVFFVVDFTAMVMSEQGETVYAGSFLVEMCFMVLGLGARSFSRDIADTISVPTEEKNTSC